jgi:hypothetical protein
MLFTAIILPALASAAREHVHDEASLKDPPLKITINPEARVSATLAGALPPPSRCGTPAHLTMKIINQGFLTSRLEAEFVGDVPSGVKLEFHSEPLKGTAEELRSLHITLTRPGPTDITITFRSHNNAPDLGGRDRVHFLMECMPDQGSLQASTKR